MEEKYIYIVIRILAIIVGLLILSLSIDINQQRRYKNHVQLTEMNFTLFTGLFSIITVVFEFIKSSVHVLNRPIITFINDILNLIFTFSASVILARITGFHSCTNDSYVRGTPVFMGSKGFCREFHALAFLSLILFFLYIILSIISALVYGKIKGSNSRLRS
ncbi:hypothetical protein T552_02034 [Pneumocystis carinii B80]|uniref:MARVEL domain-containing protein n=1 Tax=Pneumocystis carinii (strain B80) TaxID=1408658 RepID=A0A0W4ZIG0_PNEC8|nr:hypothetical protein T552_02034 [Pneumocystis carinii B80]KTW28175.1 hypothetical protein T552_02034 [Pneumocystis carinii B80]